MTATAYELATRREFTDGENPSARTTWQVNGATSYANARAALDAAIPSTFTFPSGVVAYLDKIDASEMLDDAFFEFTLDYQTQPQKSENQTEFEFDVSAATDLIYQSYATSTYVISGSTAPDFQGAVGVLCEFFRARHSLLGARHMLSDARHMLSCRSTYVFLVLDKCFFGARHVLWTRRVLSCG